MKFFIIEWWDESGTKYHQEYFVTHEAAFGRYVDLVRDVPNSRPEIETKHMEDA